MSRMVLWLGMCLLLFTGVARAQPVPADASKTADPITLLAQRLDQVNLKMTERMQALEEAVNLLKQQLGESFERPTVFNTVERRLEDMEKRLDKMERLLDDLEDQVRDMARGR